MDRSDAGRYGPGREERDRRNNEEFRNGLVAHLPQLRAFARGLARSADAADDLVHETLVRALAAQNRFEPGTNLRAWLMTILRNRYITEFRKRRRFTQVEDAIDLLSVPAGQADAVELGDVSAAMAKLSPRHREVLVLVAADGLAQEEIASICQCAIGTVKSRLHRARNELHALLNGSDPAGSGESEN